VGTLFSFLVLVTGSVWAKDAWEGYWTGISGYYFPGSFPYLPCYIMLRKSLEEAKKEPDSQQFSESLALYPYP